MLKKNFNELQGKAYEMKKLMALVAAFAMSATIEAASAQFAYQGVLRDANNAVMTGTKQIELRLYDVASGGTALWGRAYAVQLDDNGLFNIEVSDATGSPLSGVSGNSLDVVFAKTDTIYIGIKVQYSSGEIVPRQKLLPVPFAAVASNVSRASGDFTVSGKLTAKSATFSGNLTASSMNVTGSTRAGSITTSGDATITGDLTVGGAISGFGTVPIGGIIMWSGRADNLPPGWSLCDGLDGRPDLRGRFVLGAGGKYGVKATGGAEQVTLTIEQIPSHQHSFSFTGAGLAGWWENANTFYDLTGTYSGNKNTVNTDPAGGGQPHENMPPYYALCFIIRTN